MRILVLDIGTTSMRGILYETDGTPIALSRRKNHLIHMGNSLIEENPEDWAENTLEIIREIAAQYDPRTIGAVAITSQRSSVIPVDENGKPLLAAIMWQDTRNKEICEQLSEHNEELFELTGAEVSTVFSGSKMTWIRRHQPDVYRHVYKFLNIPEYVCFLMTGEFVSDRTYASRTGLMNLRTGRWEKKILDLYEVDESRLCRLIEPGDTAGYITKEYAAKCSLPAGTPVLHCGGDQQCAAIGHGIISEGILSITVGTGGFLACASRKLPEKLTKGMIWNRSSVAGEFIREANVLSCGAAFDWCAHQLYGMEEIDYQILDTELKKENFPASCICVPYFSGKGAPEWDPGARAVFSGITAATRRSELFKSVMEGVFMEIGGHIERFEETSPIRQIYCGGGMTASSTLNQLQADICGRPLYCASDPEATAFGCLLVALCGLGEYETVGEAWQALHDSSLVTLYEPDMEIHRQYQEKRKEMDDLYRTIREKKR